MRDGEKNPQESAFKEVPGKPRRKLQVIIVQKLPKKKRGGFPSECRLPRKIPGVKIMRYPNPRWGEPGFLVSVFR
jgi:hypothetical protein